jgi:hypothetical protein
MVMDVRDAERQWAGVREWVRTIHEWARQGLSATGMSCKGVPSPVAYVVFGHRLETVPFEFAHRAATLMDLRRRMVREDADGLIVAFRARLDGVVEGELTLSQFDTVTVMAWGAERIGGRWIMRAQAFEQDEQGVSWCLADEQEGTLMVPCDYEQGEGTWISQRMGCA